MVAKIQVLNISCHQKEDTKQNVKADAGNVMVQKNTLVNKHFSVTRAEVYVRDKYFLKNSKHKLVTLISNSEF